MTEVESAAGGAEGGVQSIVSQKPRQMVPRPPAKIVLRQKRSFADEIKSLLRAIIKRF